MVKKVRLGNEGDIGMKKNKKNGGSYNTLNQDDSSRRDARLASIIGIVATLVTFCSILFKCTKKVAAVWPESGHAYYIIMYSFFVIPLAASLIICFDILRYIMADLNRYNLDDVNYKMYDKDSDQKYAYVIKDFKIMLVVFLIVLIAIDIISAFLEKSIINFCIGMLICIGVFVCIIYFFKEKGCKGIEYKKAIYVIKRLIFLVLMIFIVYFFDLVFLTNSVGQLDALFYEKGEIIIENAIDENFGGANLCIYDNNDNIIDKMDISVDDVLLAKESAVQNIKNDKGKEIAKAQKLLGEMLYWRYKYNIKNLKLSNGQYYVCIDIFQKNRTVEIINMFEVEDDVYEFGRKEIHKEY